MQATYVSSAALRQAPRLNIQTATAELTDRSVEVSTGRVADAGLALGLTTGRTVAARVDFEILSSLMISNKTAIARMDVTQHALDEMEDLNSEMLAALVALPSGSTADAAITIQARAGLERMGDLANGASDGSFLFGGINSTTPPLNRYDAGPEAAVEAAFLGRFGFPVNDPAAATITAADMTDFLQNDFAALFDDPSWTTTFSNASDTDVVSRVAPDERVTTSVNANEEGFRDTVRGLAMVAGLGLESLNELARQALIDEARIAMGEAVSGIVEQAATLAFSQQAVERADERLSISRDILAQSVGDLEAVDPAEAKTRIDLLTTQIEMSYALTAQIARLSILNYA